MQKKLSKYFLIWRELHLNWFRQTLDFTERQYFSWGVNMLTNCLKILDTTELDLFELIYFLNDQKIWQENCRADLSSFSDHLTCYVSKSVLT